MKTTPKVIASIAGLIVVFTIIVFDAHRIHFDSNKVRLKQKHSSAQSHWNLFYDQRYVHYQSPFRYTKDLAEIRRLLKSQADSELNKGTPVDSRNGVAVISDLPTSYYLSATLPVYVRNIHRHQGRYSIPTTRKLLDNRDLCRAKRDGYVGRVANFMKADRQLSETKGWPLLTYFVFNKDTENPLTKTSCLNSNSLSITQKLSSHMRLIYDGEFLSLYRLN